MISLPLYFFLGARLECGSEESAAVTVGLSLRLGRTGTETASAAAAVMAAGGQQAAPRTQRAPSLRKRKGTLGRASAVGACLGQVTHCLRSGRLLTAAG